MRKRHRSLNSSDLTSKIPEKRRRHGSESNISSSINDPYIEISHHEGTLKKFSTNYFVTEFILKNAISSETISKMAEVGIADHKHQNSFHRRFKSYIAYSFNHLYFE